MHKNWGVKEIKSFVIKGGKDNRIIASYNSEEDSLEENIVKRMKQAPVDYMNILKPYIIAYAEYWDSSIKIDFDDYFKNVTFSYVDDLLEVYHETFSYDFILKTYVANGMDLGLFFKCIRMHIFDLIEQSNKNKEKREEERKKNNVLLDKVASGENSIRFYDSNMNPTKTLYTTELPIRYKRI